MICSKHYLYNGIFGNNSKRNMIESMGTDYTNSIIVSPPVSLFCIPQILVNRFIKQNATRDD